MNAMHVVETHTDKERKSTWNICNATQCIQSFMSPTLTKREKIYMGLVEQKKIVKSDLHRNSTYLDKRGNEGAFKKGEGYSFFNNSEIIIFKETQ